VALSWQQLAEGCQVFYQVLWVTTHMVQTHLCTHSSHFGTQMLISCHLFHFRLGFIFN